MTLFQLATLSLMYFVMLYAIIDRICKCFENCATDDAYKEFVKQQKKAED